MTENILDVDKKVVAITGASSGIGRAAALEFAKDGNSLILIARREDVLRELASECEQIGSQVLVIPLDVADSEQVEMAVESGIERFGKIDVWINNAAVTLFGQFEKTPMDDIHKVVETNIFGYLHGSYNVIRYFKTQGTGILINISSVAGVVGQAYSAVYAASKFAVRGLSISLQQELVENPDIHVCTVLPGVVDTPIYHQAANYSTRQIKPMSPIISPQRVAKTLLSLAFFPEKEVVVGNSARLAMLARQASPQLFDELYGQKVFLDQFQDDFAPPTPGNLFEPASMELARVDGGWKESQPERPFMQRLVLGGVIAGLFGLLLSIIVSLLIQMVKPKNPWKLQSMKVKKLISGC